MMDKAACTCIIGARAGSSRIPHKNRKVVGGRPLFRNAVDVALDSGVCSRVVVTTDDPVIMDALAGEERIVLESRPVDLAGATPSMWDVVADLMERRSGYFSDGLPLMLLTPCHPFRSAEHVREAMKLFLERRAEGLVSVTPYPCPPELALRESDGLVSRDWEGLVRAGDHPVSYYPNGAVTILTQRAFAKCRSPYTDRTVPYVMDWPDCLDIDEPGDLELARKLAGLS